MKIISSSKRRHYLAKVGIFLITATLIAGMVGCGGGLRLTITSSEGGTVTVPGEGTFTYNEGTVVDLVAEADAGYRFVDWTGYVRAIANVTAAATNITMNDSYSITANFALDICQEIQDWYDLYAIKDNLCVSYILMNDLDSTTPGYEELASPTANGGAGWQPIGDAKHPFKGISNGRGYEICDLFISRPSEDGVGFFGSVGEAGAIKDIGVVNVTVVFGDDCVGGLVGYNRGTVSNCYSTGNVTGDCRVGGLVGRNYGTVRKSYSTGSVIGYGEVGGLVGGNEHEWEGIEGTVSDCYSTGSVTGEDSIGGLVGRNSATVSNSYSSSNVTGEEYVGGLLGSSGGTVSNSYSTGSVTGYERVGGLVGDNNGPVSNSFYNYDEVLINGENIISIGALFGEDFDQWLANDKFLGVNEKLSQEGGYYVINDVDDFKQLLAFGQDNSLKFRLKNDLDLDDDPNFYIPYLAGEFDGNGHKISNLSLDSNLVWPLGLFGYLATGGKVTQVGVENVNVTGTSSVGGLVGRNRGTVSDSHSTGSVNGCHNNVGGLVGSNWGTVSNCYSSGNVTGDEYVGGLVGSSAVDVISSYSTASVTGGWGVGGLVGLNCGPVSDCYSMGSVIGNTAAGGLVGVNDRGTVSKCYATGNVNGDSGVGALVGDNYESTVSNSFWDTQTSGQSTSDGGTGKTTAQMKSITTFSGAGWNVIAVANAGTRNPAYTWNIVNGVTYPFLSWQL